MSTIAPHSHPSLSSGNLPPVPVAIAAPPGLGLAGLDLDLRQPVSTLSNTAVSPLSAVASPSESSEPSRTQQLRAARREFPPIILVGGSDGAGVSEITSRLQNDLGAVQVHTKEMSLPTGRGRKSEPSNLIFSHRDREGARHDLSLKDVLGALRELRDEVVTARSNAPHGATIDPMRPIVIDVGSAKNIAIAAEALRFHVPYVPVAGLVVTAAQSMDSSQPSFTDRLGKFMLAQAVSAGESVDDLTMKGRTLVTTALARMQAEACRDLAPAELNGGGPIPEAVILALQNNLLPAAHDLNLRPVITGGLAVAAHLGDESREVSRDVDFRVADLSKKDFQPVARQLFDRLNGGAPSFHQIPDADSPTPGKSTKVCGHTVTTSGEVDIDLVGNVRRQPHGVILEFKYGIPENAYAREVTLPNGNKVAVIAPEFSVVEKLVAGRGCEVGKFDLFDVAGLLARECCRFELVQRIIERQRLRDTDSPALLTPPTLMSALELMEAVGITDPKLKDLAYAKVCREFDDPRNEVGLNPDALKKLALVNIMLTSLNKIEATMHTPLASFGGAESMASRWGAEKISGGVQNLRDFLYFYVEHVLGSGDTYIRRTEKSFARSEEYFKKAA